MIHEYLKADFPSSLILPHRGPKTQWFSWSLVLKNFNAQRRKGWNTWSDPVLCGFFVSKRVLENIRGIKVTLFIHPLKKTIYLVKQTNCSLYKRGIRIVCWLMGSMKIPNQAFRGKAAVTHALFIWKCCPEMHQQNPPPPQTSVSEQDSTGDALHLTRLLLQGTKRQRVVQGENVIYCREHWKQHAGRHL